MIKLFAVTVVLLSLNASTAFAQGDGGELPTVPGSGDCWKCKIVTVPSGNESYSYTTCDPGHSTGHNTCTSSGVGEIATCSAGGGGCGGGNDDFSLA